VNLAFGARMPERDFAVDFALGDGETVAILGPNGAGKSTILGLIAGLLRPGSGRAVLGERTLFDIVPQGRAIWLPPHSRGVSMLAQDPLLFPHLSVLENVAFGPRSAGAGHRDALESARGWLHEVDALDLAHRKPAELSGGQAQRIAVARALASDPDLLLLDEPMAALDISVAPTLRRMLKRVLADRTAIIVTHDLLDALVLADRVIVVEGGRIVEDAPTRQALDRPRSAFAADIAVLNYIAGTRSADGLTTAEGLEVRSPAAEDIPVGAPAAVAIRPTDVSISVEAPLSAAHNRLRGRVKDLEPRGDLVRVRSGAISADVLPARIADLDLAIDDEVWFSFDPAAGRLYPT
jgi:molybdate transport system ATP-binding protein